MDEQNLKQLVYELHRELLAKLWMLVQFHRSWLRRNPTDAELNAFAGKAHTLAPSQIWGAGGNAIGVRE